jgi:hypothetical protein
MKTFDWFISGVYVMLTVRSSTVISHKRPAVNVNENILYAMSQALYTRPRFRKVNTSAISVLPNNGEELQRYGAKWKAPTTCRLSRHTNSLSILYFPRWTDEQMNTSTSTMQACINFIHFLQRTQYEQFTLILVRIAFTRRTLQLRLSRFYFDA